MSTAQPRLQTYIVVYALLMAGLAATVGVAYVHLGYWNLPTALAIAFAKATLVVLYFMHVMYSPRLTWIAVCAGLIWLAILLSLTVADYVSRDWLPVKPMPTELALPPDAESFQPPRAGSALGRQDVPHADEEPAATAIKPF
jgi:cytochrome c oxidase subunit 4